MQSASTFSPDGTFSIQEGAGHAKSGVVILEATIAIAFRFLYGQIWTTCQLKAGIADRAIAADMISALEDRSP